MIKPTHLVGSGLISSLGFSTSDALRELIAGKRGISSTSSILETKHTELPVGEVKRSNKDLADSLGVPGFFPRVSLLGIHAAREAVKNSGIQNIKKWRTGLISSTTVGGMDHTEVFFKDFVNDKTKGDLIDIKYHPAGTTTDLIAKDLGITDFVSTINTACSSSANALMLGARLIQSGRLDIVVAGGVDALTRFTLNGFNSLMILSPEECKPFDANRKGLNLGEGAGFLVLASEAVIKSEGLKSNCVISGYGNASDAFHQTASSPDGRGSFKAMSEALQMAQLKSSAIGYINAHGTGTVNNDLSESTAIKRLFGTVPKFSSTKGYTGHTLAACGAIEAIFSTMAIDNNCVFGNAGFETQMPDSEIAPQAEFQKDVRIDHVLSNSFGFGGNCSSVIFSRAS